MRTNRRARAAAAGAAAVTTVVVMTSAVVGCVDHQEPADEKVGTAESAYGGHGEYSPLGLTCEAGKVMVTSPGVNRCTYRLTGQHTVSGSPTFSVTPYGVPVEFPRSQWLCQITIGAGSCNISAENGACSVGERAGGEKPCTPPVDAITQPQIAPTTGEKLIVVVDHEHGGATPTSEDANRARRECERAYDRATIPERDHIIAQACRDEVASLNGVERGERLLCCADSPVEAGDSDGRADAGAPTCTPPKELFVSRTNVNLCNYHVEDVAWDPLRATTIHEDIFGFDGANRQSIDDATYLNAEEVFPAVAALGEPQSHRFLCAPAVSCNLVASRARCSPHEEAAGRRAECPDGSHQTSPARGLGTTFQLPDRLITTYRTEWKELTTPSGGSAGSVPVEVPVQTWETDWEAARSICRDHLYLTIQTKTQEEIRHESWAACANRADVMSFATRGSLSCCKTGGADGGAADGGTTDGGGDGGGGDAGTTTSGGGDGGTIVWPDGGQTQLPSYPDGGATTTPHDAGAD